MLKAVIIDDESACIETLQLMLQKKFSQQVKVVGSAFTAPAAIQVIQNEKPDLVFLDVEMPHVSGIDLLQSIPVVDFHVVFTTAHQQYAIKAIKLNALDYLTKPISLDELGIAIEKCAASQAKQQTTTEKQAISQSNKKVAILFGSQTQYIPVNEIVRIESHSNYSIIYFTNRPKQTVTKTLKEFEESLTAYNFLRIHHSHLVNIDHVIGYKNQDHGYLVVYGNEIIEISRRKKPEVMQRLQTMKG